MWFIQRLFFYIVNNKHQKMAGVLPPNASYFMQRLQGYSSSHFKILPQTTGTMQSNSIIRFELPSNSYVNFGKGGIRMFFNAAPLVLADVSQTVLTS
jgi:hypothetical protein